MRKILSLLVIVLGFCSHSLYAQDMFLLVGRVVDSASGNPLTGASVYCQNTTLGVITNQDGLFQMKLPRGGYDLGVSFTSYQSATIRINSSQTDSLIVYLKPKEKNLEAVTVAGSNEVPDGWVKYGSFFQEQFFGNTVNAGQCVILNPETLRFFFSKKRNRLKVLAKDEIQIENKALGYKIRYQLDSMSFEYGTGISMVSGVPFYEELNGDAAQLELWKKNREKAYQGSKLHFMRSWYDGNLKEEGFEIEKVNTAVAKFEAAVLPDAYDSTFYHADSTSVEIDLVGKFRIKFKKELPDPQFVTAYKLPAQLRVQLSVLDLLGGFVIEENGYWYEQSDLVNSGYWSYERMAEALPYDYQGE